MKSLKKNSKWTIGKYLLPVVLNVLLKSLRFNISSNEAIEQLLSSGQNFVVAFWHGKMIAGWYLFNKKNFAALISKSKDGEILAKLLAMWKFEVVRGSSHKGGKESMQILLDLVTNKYSIAITPDGPTGPAKVMKPGAVVISKKTGIPLVLVGIAYKRKWILNSWDKFELPKPFSEVFVKYSEPKFISSDLSYEETDEQIKGIGLELETLNKEVENLC